MSDKENKLKFAVLNSDDPQENLAATLELLHYIQPDVEELNNLAGSGIKMAISALKGADLQECINCIDFESVKDEKTLIN